MVPPALLMPSSFGRAASQPLPPFTFGSPLFPYLVRGASDEAVAHGRKWCLGARYQRGSTTPGALLSLARRGLVRPGVSTRHYTTATRVFRSDPSEVCM
jgi:hypothetical protein